MKRIMLNSKLHRARVTGTNLWYVGSITIDPALVMAANLLVYEQVHVFNITAGTRFVTYVIEGEKSGDGEICLNGAAARLAAPGDEIIILSFVELSEEEAAEHEPTILTLNEKNEFDPE
ncbi:MAG: aspartate 1-decarboxylase [Planctomycetota bacterium]|jgi:aspartate 1-decarboxylase